MSPGKRAFFTVGPGAAAYTLVLSIQASHPIWLSLLYAALIGAIAGGLVSLFAWGFYRVIIWWKGPTPLVRVRYLALNSDYKSTFNLCLKSLEQFRGLKLNINNPSRGKIKAHQFDGMGDTLIEIDVRKIASNRSAVKIQTEPVINIALTDFGHGEKALNKIVSALPSVHDDETRIASAFSSSEDT